MVPDQATELRNLMRRRARGAPLGPAPCLIALCGAQPRVGVSTVALHLAIALAELGSRVVLVDSPSCGPVSANPLEQGTIADILAARRDIHEALRAGPGGIQVLVGPDAPSAWPPVPPHGIERLIGQLQSLGRHAEAVLLDLSAVPPDLLRGIGQRAAHIVLVTPPTDPAVLDTYALVKTLGRGSPGHLHLLVNRAADDQQALRVHARLAQSCERFLALSLDLIGHVPEDAALGEPAPAPPLLSRSPGTPVARALAAVAGKLQTLVEQRDANPKK